MSAAKKLVTDKVNSIIGREVERATTEVKKKLREVGLGIALLALAAVLGVFGLGLALATIAAALATVFSTWLALLIVTGGVFVLAGVLVAFGVRRLSKKDTATTEDEALTPRS
jgi:magnesium-transporting ATPase (P-type)